MATARGEPLPLAECLRWCITCGCVETAPVSDSGNLWTAGNSNRGAVTVPPSRLSCCPGKSERQAQFLPWQSWNLNYVSDFVVSLLFGRGNLPVCGAISKNVVIFWNVRNKDPWWHHCVQIDDIILFWLMTSPWAQWWRHLEQTDDITTYQLMTSFCVVWWQHPCTELT